MYTLLTLLTGCWPAFLTYCKMSQRTYAVGLLWRLPISTTRWRSTLTTSVTVERNSWWNLITFTPTSHSTWCVCDLPPSSKPVPIPHPSFPQPLSLFLSSNSSLPLALFIPPSPNPSPYSSPSRSPSLSAACSCMHSSSEFGQARCPFLSHLSLYQVLGELPHLLNLSEVSHSDWLSHHMEQVFDDVIERASHHR